jgi:hypothetical protein
MMSALGWHVMPSRVRVSLACGLAAAVLSATAVLAQTDVPQTTNSGSSKTEVPAANDTTTNAKPAPAEVEPQPAQTSPSTKTVLDYEASEQISEDFSVSFPVDI